MVGGWSLYITEEKTMSKTEMRERIAALEELVEVLQDVWDEWDPCGDVEAAQERLRRVSDE